MLYQFQKASKNNPVCIKIGDRDKVKSSVKTPKYDWGKGVTHKECGCGKRQVLYYSEAHSFACSSLDLVEDFQLSFEPVTDDDDDECGKYSEQGFLSSK